MSKKLDEILSENSVPTDRFNSLSPIAQDALKVVLRYGENEPKTCAKAALQLNLTENRVRQIAGVALMKMSGIFTATARTRPLSDFL